MAKTKKIKIVETDAEPKSRIEDILQQYDKLTKKEGNIIILGANENIVDIDVIPSGILSLDRILGIGGLPHGRIIEVFGEFSGGKTTLTLQAIAEAQRQGGIAAFIDVEHSISPSYAAKLGVDFEKVLFSQPSNAEEALGIAVKLSGLLSGGDIIVLDSVAALAPKVELDGEMTDQQMGLTARLMGKALRKITASASRSGVTVILINQIRQLIGVTFGPTSDTPGGRSLKFSASIRLDIRKIGMLKKDGCEPYGAKTRIKVVKNKLSIPFREVEVELIFGQGIPKHNDLFLSALNEGFIEHLGGGRYCIDGEAFAHGKDAAMEKFRNDSELMNNIEQRLRKLYFNK